MKTGIRAALPPGTIRVQSTVWADRISLAAFRPAMSNAEIQVIETRICA
jgi:hypothetical protein